MKKQNGQFTKRLQQCRKTGKIKNTTVFVTLRIARIQTKILGSLTQLKSMRNYKSHGWVDYVRF